MAAGAAGTIPSSNIHASVYRSGLRLVPLLARFADEGVMQMLEIKREKKLHALGEMRLESGERLRNARICYQVIGTPNRARDNLVLIPSYYGGTHWGSLPLLGAEGPLAGGDYCVVLSNLFGAGWSTSPSNAAQDRKVRAFHR